MTDTTNDPQPVDPPVNTGGGSEPIAEEEPETTESAAVAVDPPVNTGGGG
jgi:hypothetical protein